MPMPIGWTAWAKDIWSGPNRSGQLRLQAWKKTPGHGKEGPPTEARLEDHDSGPQQGMTPPSLSGNLDLSISSGDPDPTTAAAWAGHTEGRMTHLGQLRSPGDTRTDRVCSSTQAHGLDGSRKPGEIRTNLVERLCKHGRRGLAML